jgi:SAM-dependent methyltransferase
MSSDRLAREREFHDRAFADDTRGRVGRFYAVARRSQGFYEAQLRRRCAGAAVLEYGCGQGSSAYELAAAGARSVLGIDISPVAIEQARERAELAGCPASTRFEVMDAERLVPRDDTFDLCCGSAILHHLDLDRAFAELARTLRPAGSALFYEPLGHNPAINLYRRATPELRTTDEHPLRTQDLVRAARWFGRVEARYFHMTALAAAAAYGRAPFEPLLRGLEHVDRAVFRLLPAARRWAWVVVLSLSEPVKHGVGPNVVDG